MSNWKCFIRKFTRLIYNVFDGKRFQLIYNFMLLLQAIPQKSMEVFVHILICRRTLLGHLRVGMKHGVILQTFVHFNKDHWVLILEIGRLLEMLDFSMRNTGNSATILLQIDVCIREKVLLLRMSDDGLEKMKETHCSRKTTRLCRL